MEWNVLGRRRFYFFLISLLRGMKAILLCSDDIIGYHRHHFVGLADGDAMKWDNCTHAVDDSIPICLPIFIRPSLAWNSMDFLYYRLSSRTRSLGEIGIPREKNKLIKNGPSTNSLRPCIPHASRLNANHAECRFWSIGWKRRTLWTWCDASQAISEGEIVVLMKRFCLIGFNFLSLRHYKGQRGKKRMQCEGLMSIIMFKKVKLPLIIISFDTLFWDFWNQNRTQTRSVNP